MIFVVGPFARKISGGRIQHEVSSEAPRSKTPSAFVRSWSGSMQADLTAWHAPQCLHSVSA